MSERVFEFGLQFQSAAERLRGERERRAALADKALPFEVSFLDDVLRKILPHDLVLLGARTGAGKTALATLVANANAKAGRRVHYFALEAEPDEIERRLKYQWLVNAAFAARSTAAAQMNYPDWYLGQFAHIDEFFGERAEKALAHQFRTLFTYYRGRDFTVADIGRLFAAVQDQTDLIVLDHLHYVDVDDGSSENRAVKDIVKRVRDLGLEMGVPVLVIAHLRKKDRLRSTVVPDLEEFHGSSDITKIVTKAILLAPAVDQPWVEPWVAPTYMFAAKDRMAGATRYAALIGFDLRRSAYQDSYVLGRLDPCGETWTPVETEKRPAWAKHALTVERKQERQTA